MTDSLKLPPQEPITALQSPAILPLKEENNEKIEPVPVQHYLK